MIDPKKIHREFARYGKIAIYGTRQCIARLDIILEHKIYEKEGFNDIYDYARTHAGLSDNQIKTALWLHSSFKALPALHSLLKNGSVGISKLARVVSIATTENQKELSQKVKLLPKKALETFIKDYQLAQKGAPPPKLGFGQKFSVPPKFIPPPKETAPGNTTETNKIPSTFGQLVNNMAQVRFLPGQESRIDNKTGKLTNPLSSDSHEYKSEELYLNAEVTQKLLELQNKGIDINNLLIEILKKRENTLAQQKNELAKTAASGQKTSRYIPAKIRHHLKNQHGNKCSIEHCKKPAQTIHHTQRFALAKNHDPRYLAPLCTEHHKIAHTIDRNYHEIRTRAG